MKQIFEDVIYYSQAVVGIYIILNALVMHEQYTEVQTMYDLVAVETEHELESNIHIEDLSILHGTFRQSFVASNEYAEPFLELIKLADEGDFKRFKEDLQYAASNVSEYNKEVGSDIVSKKLVATSQSYSKLRPYVRQWFLRKSIYAMGTLYSNCCFCLSRYRPYVEHQGDKVLVYLDYLLGSHPFFKIYVDGSPVRYNEFTWTPEKAGTHTFDLEYKYVDGDEVVSVCDELTLEVVE